MCIRDRVGVDPELESFGLTRAIIANSEVMPLLRSGEDVRANGERVLGGSVEESDSYSATREIEAESERGSSWSAGGKEGGLLLGKVRELEEKGEGEGVVRREGEAGEISGRGKGGALNPFRK